MQESLFTTVSGGRTNPKFQYSVGMTVQTLPVYAKFTDETTVLDYLKAGEEQMVGCRKHDEGVRDIDICTENQRALLDSFNQTEVPYDDSQTIVSMFRRQVAKTPDNIAVVYQDKRFTYKELDEISDRIAAYIVSKGLGREDVVSVLIPRCEWMAIASLGVLKAGPQVSRGYLNRPEKAAEVFIKNPFWNQNDNSQLVPFDGTQGKQAGSLRRDSG